MHITLREPKKIFRENIFGISQWGSQSSQLRKLYFQLVKLHFACSTCCYNVTMFNLELDTCASRARLVLHASWSSKPVLRVLCLHFKLRSSSQSWKLVLHALYLYYKVVIFQLVLETCTSRTRLVLQSCDRALYLRCERARLVLQSCNFPSRVVLQKLRLSS